MRLAPSGFVASRLHENSYKEPLSNNNSWSKDFDRWWDSYPNKVAKKPAAAIWKRSKPDIEVLMADVKERLARDSKWKAGYIPNPTTYLNQERWKDEINERRNGSCRESLQTPQSRGKEALERKRRRRRDSGSGYLNSMVDSGNLLTVM